MFFQHDLGVGGHVGLELLAGIVDGDFYLEAGDVVLLDAERRNLSDASVEGAIFERFDADARRLIEPDAADICLIDFASDKHLPDVAKGHHQRRIGAKIENR